MSFAKYPPFCSDLLGVHGASPVTKDLVNNVLFEEK